MVRHGMWRTTPGGGNRTADEVPSCAPASCRRCRRKYSLPSHEVVAAVVKLTAATTNRGRFSTQVRSPASDDDVPKAKGSCVALKAMMREGGSGGKTEEGGRGREKEAKMVEGRASERQSAVSVLPRPEWLRLAIYAWRDCKCPLDGDEKGGHTSLWSRVVPWRSRPDGRLALPPSGQAGG